jgi:tRNA pseudouridine55 synthase
VKVQGERLHEKAREGEDFTPPFRSMTFFDLKVGLYQVEKWQFGFSCSKGSFVRSWASALCSKLGVAGTLSALRRTYSYPYSLDDAISLDSLSSLLVEGGEEKIKESPFFIGLGKALPDWVSLRVYGYDLHLLRNGQISKNLKAQLIRSYQPGSKFPGFKVFAENTSNLVALIGLEVGKGFFIKRGFRES